MKFEKTTPCKSCPYRTDAKLGLWSKQHYIDLLNHEQNPLGVTYECHKRDDHVCRGWLLDQWNRNLPSVKLRISLSTNNVPRSYLDSLHSPAPLYESVAAMCLANFPGIELPPPTATELFWQAFFAQVSEESSDQTDLSVPRSDSIG